MAEAPGARQASCRIGRGPPLGGPQRIEAMTSLLGDGESNSATGRGTRALSESRELQRIWASAQALEWRSLALIPASDDVRVVPIARAFSALGFRSRGESIGVADFRDVHASSFRGPLEVIRWHVRRGERVILALRPCSAGDAMVSLVRAADCAILCVGLGASRIAPATAMVEQVGRDRFIGTVLLRSAAFAEAGWAARAYRRLRAVPWLSRAARERCSRID
jgi:hypothetical protein